MQTFIAHPRTLRPRNGGHGDRRDRLESSPPRLMRRNRDRLQL